MAQRFRVGDVRRDGDGRRVPDGTCRRMGGGAGFASLVDTDWTEHNYLHSAILILHIATLLEVGSSANWPRGGRYLRQPGFVLRVVLERAHYDGTLRRLSSCRSRLVLDGIWIAEWSSSGG